MTENIKLENLKLYGWNSFFENQFKKFNEPDFICGRITVENKNNYSAITENGEILCELSGKLMFTSDENSELPKAGDWVVLQQFDDDRGIIHEVLERKTKISRKVPGKKTDEQVQITNVDFIFIVQSLDNNFNINRLERYLVMVYESGAEPIIILSKADLCEEYNERLNLVKQSYPEIKTLAISSFSNYGLMELTNLLIEGKTYAFLGSSGVGKSTIINKLVGEEIQKTNEVRASDSRGKHTTTKRELILLPGKGVLIDTPGMRGLKLWSSEEGMEKTFDEFDMISESCKYKDCTHTHEKGCAVIEAVNKGEISEKKYENYLKLRKELRYLETRVDHKKYLEEKKKWKEIKVWYKKNFKEKKRN